MALALTAAQRNIWLDQMTQGDSPLYNIGATWRSKGSSIPNCSSRPWTC
ncbi:hypothetical protein QNM99_19740 [Pseudomonas sp. PCH446]